MTDWKKQGGWTGSLNAWVHREIAEHFRTNPLAKRSRYPICSRFLHRIFDGGTFGWFILLYVAAALAVGFAEFGLSQFRPTWIPQWTGGTEIKSLLTNVASYLITAQVGVLTVVSIAIGLVTIIAQRENASSEVQIYYHESFAFGVVASSIALLAVLCAQLLWPAQFTLHRLGYGTGLQFFKIMLTAVHVMWILLNLTGVAHFVATTLAFVEQRTRERLRENYTTNVVLPVDMRERLREQLFTGAGPGFVEEFWPGTAEHEKPMVYLGADFGRHNDIEIPFEPSTHTVLYDVRMAWVRWAVGRWLRRCRTDEARQGSRARTFADKPLLVFPPRLDVSAELEAGLCRRKGGVPLSRVEKFALRWAFKFRRKRDEA